MQLSEKYKIIIIEPSPVVQQGIMALFATHSRFTITYLFSDLHTFNNTFLKPDFHFIIFNPLLIGYHKQFAVKNLFAKYPDAFVVGLVYSYIDNEVLDGFDGLLNIYSSGVQMVKKLQDIIDSTNQNEQKNITENVELSDREKEILISVAIGLTNKEIAERHNISVHTVVSHRKNISRKIGIKTVSGLTIYAIFNNLISEADIN